MRSWIVSYADQAFQLSQKMLMESAIRYGVDNARAWDRSAVEQSVLYRLHKSTLDMPRGSGYWLWKPFIIKETLKEMSSGDILTYSDAGIEIIEDISPLYDLCLRKGLLLFDGHYDNAGSPGPNICSKWTKRDCFVFIDCDEPYYYQSRMLDASFIVLTKTEKSVPFIHEWFLYCSQPPLLTDQPNICAYPNLPDFIEHRHDQSILSLLAARNRVELFRHPSQYGNHLKAEKFRQPGEWKREAYGVSNIYYNSPYKTLLNHHRGNVDCKDMPQISLRQTIPASQQKVFSAWTNPEEMKKCFGFADCVVISSESDLRVGGKYSLKIMNLKNNGLSELTGEYIEVNAPIRVVFSWPWASRVTVEFHDQGYSTEVVLTHELFTNERLRYQHLIGWKASLNKLAEIVSS